MKKYKLLLAGLMAISAVAGSISYASFNLEQSLNFYTRGSLINPSNLSNTDQDPGILKLYHNRNRNYGAFEMVTMLKNIAMEMAKQYPNHERLQIGDVANKKGGSIGSHASHQNGLDADVVYFRKNNQEQNPDWAGSYVEKFVKAGKVTANFDMERNWSLLQKLTSFPQVQRIFVDIRIKRAFCNLYASNQDESIQHILRVLRPAIAHDDHMHIRIACPPSSTHCIAQPPQAEGNGCSPQQLEMDLKDSILDEVGAC